MRNFRGWVLAGKGKQKKIHQRSAVSNGSRAGGRKSTNDEGFRTNVLLMLLFCCSMVLLFSSFSSAATVELRQTGQTTSYATGDDGNLREGIAWPFPRFVVNTGAPDNGGSVTDKLTGLIWAKNANIMPTRDPGFDLEGPGCNPAVPSTCNDGFVAWQHALDYVKKLNDESYLGYTDWRLPTVNELQSLLDSSRSNPPLSAGHPFTNVYVSSYWSSSTYQFDTTRAWQISMYNATVFVYLKDDESHFRVGAVWPVRAGQAGTADPAYPANIWKTGQTTSYDANSPQKDDGALQRGVSWPSPRFIDHMDGTVTDNLTGLTWLKDAHCFGTQTWATALSSANALQHGSCGLTDNSVAGDWRLPNSQELHSLTDYSQSNPALPSGHLFTNVISLDGFYWSSTDNALNSNHNAAWYVGMQQGNLSNALKTNSYYVWPVSGGAFYGSPVVSVSPPSWDFGTIDPNSSSSPQTFTIMNTGTNNLYIGAITKTGTNPDQFSIQNDNCSNITVAPPLGTCALQVVFSPTSGGQKYASVSIPSNAPVTPTTVALTGKGTVPTYTISYNPPVLHGTLFCSPNPVDEGLTATCSATPDTGYHITSISGCGGTDPGPQPYGASYTSYMTGVMYANCDITATFAINTYAISVSPTGSGTATCDPNPVDYNGSSTCAMSPDTGYYIASVTVDSVPQSPVSPYIFNNVTATHTITVEFWATDPILRVSSGGVNTWYTLIQGIQTAYNEAASSGDVIKTKAMEFTEVLDFARDVSFSLQGGWGQDFATPSGMTTVNGSMTISNGSVVVANLVIR